MGTRTRTTLTPATARELAANRPPSSQRRKVDYAALGRLGAAKREANRKERNERSRTE